jgi:hypothetical protein
MRIENINEVPILIHTMDAYSTYWDTWYHLFKKYTTNHGPIYFLTEEKEPSFVNEVNHIKSGKGEWGYRLKKGFEQVPSDILFYMQEDNWAYASFEFKQEYLDKFYELDMHSLRFHKCAWGEINYVSVEDNLFRYTQHSRYLMGHQMGLWDKNFFNSNVLDTDNPWSSELEGTPRWYDTNHRIYQYDIAWYWSTCRRGELQDIGREILKNNGITEFDDTPIPRQSN